MTTPLDYISENLPHEDNCPADEIPFRGQPHGKCNCSRAEVIAWVKSAAHVCQAQLDGECSLIADEESVAVSFSNMVLAFHESKEVE